ncbi:interleukin-8-like isoform X1 [Harpia harpyja]|uniref:interleukin-8-like isoform X1 n=2 Tax=Harpia harpyja TaxID=202280 RepID=UPI0022B1BE61|nr:interleukin-8-like isoform X1 [Harpia harpyja]
MTCSWCWSAPGRPRQYIITAGPRAQALATLGAAGAHLTTEPDPGGTRKKHSCIMTGKAVAAVLTLLLISAVGTKGKALPRSAIELRCQCPSTHSKFIHPKFIQNVNLTPSGPHCKNVEVIATLTDGREVCLEPTAPWVKLIIKAILDKANAKPEIVS